VFDDDAELHDRIEAIFASMMRPPPAPVGHRATSCSPTSPAPLRTLGGEATPIP